MFYNLKSEADVKTAEAQRRLERIQNILVISDDKVDVWAASTPEFSMPEKPKLPMLTLPKEPDFLEFTVKNSHYDKPEPKKDDPEYWKDLKDIYATIIWLSIIGMVIFLVIVLFGNL